MSTSLGGLASMQLSEPKQNEHTRSYTQDLPIGHNTGWKDLKRGVSNWGPEILGFAGDIGDVLTNTIQRAQGKRGPNLRPGELGNSARRRFSHAARAPNLESVIEEPSDIPPLELAANIANPLLFLSPAKMGALVEKYPNAASILGILHGLPDGVGSPQAGALGIIKERGGNWLNRDIEQALSSVNHRGAWQLHPDIVPYEDANHQGWMLHRSTGEIFDSREVKEILNARAVNDWINGPFTKYLKRDLGTDNDPILRLLNEGKEFNDIGLDASKVNAHGTDVHPNIGLIGKTPAAKAFEFATDSSIMDNYGKDLKRPHMIPSPNGGPGAYNLSHPLPNGDIWIRPGEGGKSALATPMDYTLGHTEEEALAKAEAEIQRRYEKFYKDDAKWLSNLQDDDKVYGFGYPTHMTQDTGLEEIPLWIRNALEEGIITPQQLKSGNFSVEAAVRAMHDAREADKIAQAKLASEEAELARRYSNTIREFPEGHSLIQYKLPEKVPEGVKIRTNDDGTFSPLDSKGEPVMLIDPHRGEEEIFHDTPEKAYLAGQLAIEGNRMGHCVGRYCEAVARGEQEIYSIWDPSGKPKATISVYPKSNPRGWDIPDLEQIDEMVGLNSDLEKTMYQELANILPEGVDPTPVDMVEWLKDNHPSLAAQSRAQRLYNYYRQKPAEIGQIKGQSNEQIDPTAVPHLLDFINNPPEHLKSNMGWGQVRDEHYGGIRQNRMTGDWEPNQRYAEGGLVKNYPEGHFDDLELFLK